MLCLSVKCNVLTTRDSRCLFYSCSAFRGDMQHFLYNFVMILLLAWYHIVNGPVLQMNLHHNCPKAGSPQTATLQVEIPRRCVQRQKLPTAHSTWEENVFQCAVVNSRRRILVISYKTVSQRLLKAGFPTRIFIQTLSYTNVPFTVRMGGCLLCVFFSLAALLCCLVVILSDIT